MHEILVVMCARVKAVLLAVLMGSAAVLPAWAGDIELIQAVSPRTPVFVAPGESAPITVSVRNVGNQAVPLTTLRSGYKAWLSHSPDAWTFGPSASPRCSDIRRGAVGPFNLWVLELDVHDLLPGEQVDCVYVVQRSATTSEDMSLGFGVVLPVNDPGPAGNSAAWVLGVLTELVFNVSEACDVPTAPGERIMRVSLENRGPTAVDTVGFGTCLHHGVPGFAVDGSLPGGCGPSVGAPGLCLGVGVSVGWTLPATAAGETASCLLRLHSHGGSGPDGLTVTMKAPYRSAVGGLRVLDLKQQTQMGGMSLHTPSACTRAVAAPVMVPVNGLWWLWLLVIGVVGVGLHARKP